MTANYQFLAERVIGKLHFFGGKWLRAVCGRNDKRPPIYLLFATGLYFFMQVLEYHEQYRYDEE